MTTPADSNAFEENAFGDRFLRTLNGDVFDLRPARDVFERHFEQDFTKPDQLFVVVGSDSGLLLDYFATLKPGRATRILLVEPDAIAARIASERGLAETDIEADVQLLRESDWLARLQAQNLAGYVYSGKMMMLKSLASKMLFDERYSRLALDVRRAMGASAHEIMTKVNNRLFIDRQLQNAPYNGNSAAVLRGIGDGGTAVILGGGPSLDQDIDWIMANRDRMTVIAVSRLCEKLDHLGLRPDIVVSVDPQHGMYEISKAGIRWEDTLLVNMYHVAPALLQQWRGPSLRLGSPLPWPSALDGKLPDVSGPGPTVSHAATWMACEFGFHQILLSGVDLCFSASGDSHASDTPEARLATPALRADQIVETYSGRQAATNLQLKTSLENMAALAERITDTGVSLINLSAEAARIERIEHRPASEIVLPAGKTDISALPLADHQLETCRVLRRELHTTTRSLIMIRNCCRKAERYLDRLHGLDGKPGDYRYKARLDHLEASLEKSFGPVLHLIKHYAGDEFTALCNPSGFVDMDEQAMADWGKSYYRILGQTARALRARLAEVIEAVGFLVMENEIRPDVDALLAHWQANGITGRAWHLLRHRSQALDTAAREKLQQALAAFEATIDSEETVFASTLAEQSDNTANIVAHLKSLLESENRTALLSLADRLSDHSGPHAALAALARGFHAELAGSHAAAISDYEAVVDMLGARLESHGELDGDYLPLLEPALMHTAQANLQVGDVPAALDSLGVLVQHSIEYTPLYAGLLRSHGFLQEALDTLVIYLEARPENWRVREEIAQLYRLLGNPAAADTEQALADQSRQAESLPRAA